MKVEFTRQQISSMKLAVETVTEQLKAAKLRHEKLSNDLDLDIAILNRIKNKILRINPQNYTIFTKYEIYNLINTTSEYEELHEHPQDQDVNKVVKVRSSILEIIKSPLPYIDILYIREIGD